MVSPLHPGHPIVGIPPVYSPRNLAAPMATSMMASLPSISSLQTGQRERYSSGGGPKGPSRSSGGIGSWRLRRIFPPFDGLELIIDDAIGRMPDAPHAHLPLTVRTDQGISPSALLIALAVGHRSDDLARPLDDTLHLGQGVMNHALELLKRLRRLHPVGAYPLKSLGKHMLNHPADKRLDFHRFPLDVLALVRTVVRGDPLAIIAINAPEGDRWTHHIFGQIGRQALRARRDIALLYVGDEPIAIARVTDINQTVDLFRPQRLAQHRQQMPLPLFSQHRIWQRVEMDPLLGLLSPSTTGGDEVQMGIVLAIAAMGLDDDDVTAFEVLAADPAEDVIQAPHPTAHERTQHRWRLLIKSVPQNLRHGEDDMTVDDALMQHLADLADPVVDVNLGAPQAQRRLTTHSDAMGALPAIQAPVVDVPYLVRVPACEHLVYKLIIVSLMVPRMASFEAVPVLGKDLLEDVPVLRGCCNHAGAPSWGSRIFAVQLLYHVSSAQSTPSSAFTQARSSPSLTLEPRGLQASRKMEIPVRSSNGGAGSAVRAPWRGPSPGGRGAHSASAAAGTSLGGWRSTSSMSTAFRSSLTSLRSCGRALSRY